MLFDISQEQWVRMRAAVLDADSREALALLKEFIRRLEQQQQGGLKSHLEG